MQRYYIDCETDSGRIREKAFLLIDRGLRGYGLTHPEEEITQNEPEASLETVVATPLPLGQVVASAIIMMLRRPMRLSNIVEPHKVLER